MTHSGIADTTATPAPFILDSYLWIMGLDLYMMEMHQTWVIKDRCGDTQGMSFDMKKVFSAKNKQFTGQNWNAVKYHWIKPNMEQEMWM